MWCVHRSAGLSHVVRAYWYTSTDDDGKPVEGWRTGHMGLCGVEDFGWEPRDVERVPGHVAWVECGICREVADEQGFTVQATDD